MDSSDIGVCRADTAGRACIWQQAGVVRRRTCQLRYECPQCRFDRALRRVATENRTLAPGVTGPGAERAKIVFWKQKLRQLPASKRACVHHLKGRIAFRACTHDYRCGNCEFDQYFSDQYSVYTAVQPVALIDIDGVKIPQGYYLHAGHAWARLEENSTVRIGLDDFASRLLGPVDAIQPPLMGKAVGQGQAAIRVRRGTQQAQVRVPLSGVITAVNPQARKPSHCTRADAYANGWILQLHATRLRPELKNLMIAREAHSFLKREINGLYDLIETEAGIAAADGGFLGDDISGHVPLIGWQKLVRRFIDRQPVSAV